jgi:LysM repeat protein
MGGVMKPTLLFATLSMVFAVPQVFAATELETLRARCSEQERHIRQLEEQVQKLKSGSSGPSAPVAKTSAAASNDTASSATHTVRPGESLERIARRAGCSPAQLAKANGLKTSSIIHPGQKLKLPGRAVAQADAPAATAPATRPTVPATASATAKTYKIKAGETYASISRKHRVSIASLVAANPGVKPTALRPGQMIRLSSDAPASVPVPAPAPAPQEKPAPHMASAPVVPLTPLASAPVPLSAPTPLTTPVAATKGQESPTPPSAKTPPISAPTAPEQRVNTPASVPSQEQASAPTSTEKKIRSVTIEGEMTYGQFAATHGTDTSRLNDLNGLDLTNATVLAKGSELYVPAQP